MQKITPFLWFDKEAGEAARFYVSVFKDAKITSETKMENTPSGTVEVIGVELMGQQFTLMSAGPLFKFTEAISFVIDCETQEEVDYYWEKLSAVPESEQCGWVKDKYGLSWQIVPTIMNTLLSDPDKEKANRVTQAMLKMKKLDIQALKNAAA
ncbi:MAG: VOC family protein [Patescibacteria group bacterium]|jgi:predicted 3-demethylubiquinone-9 3-methyltransferase (glyoxalase superfamily)